MFWYGPRQANLVLIAYASSEGSGEPAHPRSLARTFAARSYKQWIKRNLQTESQIRGPSEWLDMRGWNLSWRNARRHKFAWRGSYIKGKNKRLNNWLIFRLPELSNIGIVHYSCIIICPVLMHLFEQKAITQMFKFLPVIPANNWNETKVCDCKLSIFLYKNLLKVNGKSQKSYFQMCCIY